MPHFQLITTDGVTLGPVELAQREWEPGNVINGADDSSLRVVEVIPSEDREKFDIVVVEQVT